MLAAPFSFCVNARGIYAYPIVLAELAWLFSAPYSGVCVRRALLFVY